MIFETKTASERFSDDSVRSMKSVKSMKSLRSLRSEGENLREEDEKVPS